MTPEVRRNLPQPQNQKPALSWTLFDPLKPPHWPQITLGTPSTRQRVFPAMPLRHIASFRYPEHRCNSPCTTNFHLLPFEGCPSLGAPPAATAAAAAARRATSAGVGTPLQVVPRAHSARECRTVLANLPMGCARGASIPTSTSLGASGCGGLTYLPKGEYIHAISSRKNSRLGRMTARCGVQEVACELLGAAGAQLLLHFRCR